MAPRATAAPKPPPALWYRGIIRNPVEGLRVGTQVLFRRSREGGWRVMSRTRQALLSDATVAHFVIALRSKGEPVVLASEEQTRANDHLANIFRHRVLIGQPIAGTSFTELKLGRD